MTVEIVLLALATTVRPTSVAALYALLASGAPRRLITAYILAGLAFTIAFGLLVVWAFDGVSIGAGTSETKGIVELLAGAAALTLAFLVHAGRIGGRAGAEAPQAPDRWARLLEERITLRTAALAGPATHIPGLFYLIALNVIAAHGPGRLEGLVEVLVYNLVWFALPIGALAVCIVRPEAARAAVGGVQAWTKDHSRMIITVVAAGVGAALVLRGLLTL